MQVILALILSSQRPNIEGRRERKANVAAEEALLQRGPAWSLWGLCTPDPGLGK